MKFFNLGLLAAVIVALACTGNDANAQLFRRNDVVVNTAGAQVRVESRGLFRSQSRVIVNDRSAAVQIRTPAYVNSQLLIQRNRRPVLFTNQLNTFTYTPYNNVANIRFINRGIHYQHVAPIVAAPIIQQYTLPPQAVTAGDGCGCETTATETTTGDAQYSTAPPARVIQRVVTPAPVVVQRQVVQYVRQPVVIARLEDRRYFYSNPRFVRSPQFIRNCH